MKTTTVRADEDSLHLAGEVAKRQGISTATLLRRELVKAVDKEAEINPGYAAFVIEVAHKRHARTIQEVEAGLGACVAANFAGPLPPFPKSVELGARGAL